MNSIPENSTKEYGSVNSFLGLTDPLFILFIPICASVMASKKRIYRVNSFVIYLFIDLLTDSLYKYSSYSAFREVTEWLRQNAENARSHVPAGI